MGKITATQLRRQTGRILNSLEEGETFLIIRNGRAIGRLKPLPKPKRPSWKEIMTEIWRIQKSVRSEDRVNNIVLQERLRRKR